MLTDKKIQAITLLVENKHNKTDIAEMLGICRSTLYDWLKDEEFKAELDSCLHRIQTYGENQIKANLSKCIDNMVKIANGAESEKVRSDANQYLIDRVLGKTTAKIDLAGEVKTDETQITDADIDKDFEEFEEDYQDE